MKIASSAIAMSSERKYNYYAQKSEAALITTSEQAATLDFSKEGVSMVEQLKEQQAKIEREREEQQKQNMAKLFSEQSQKAEKEKDVRPDEKDEMQLKLELLRKMIKALNGMKKGNSKNAVQELLGLKAEYKKSFSYTKETAIKDNGVSVSNGGSADGNAVNATTWTRTTVKSAFVTETEHTAYQAAGLVKTADGREISFGVTLEMSRAFCAKYDSLVQEDFIVTDPLVINLDTNLATVTDQKFLFDLDADGTEDEISFAGEGSGFLALDKNDDGTINDGTELFGTQSGDGFRDLAAYDSDDNGWIDENDAVFSELKVWTKDDWGNDKLLNLKEAGVGAIYLSSASTEFSLKGNDTFTTNGIVRKTGIYLKESGEVSTIQHVDLAL